MDELLKEGAKVSTPIGLMGLLGVIGLLVYLRYLRHRERVYDGLPPDQRARAIDADLIRLGIGGEKLTRDQKFQLIKENFERSSRQTLVIIAITAIVFTICFAVSAYAFLKRVPETGGDGKPTNTASTVVEDLQLAVVNAGPDDVALPLTFKVNVVLYNPGAMTETLLSMCIALDTSEETGLTYNTKEAVGPFVLKTGDATPLHLKLRVQKLDFENSANWKGPKSHQEANFNVCLRIIAVSPEGKQVMKRIKLGDLYYHDPTGSTQEITFKPFGSSMTGKLSLFK